MTTRKDHYNYTLSEVLEFMDAFGLESIDNYQDNEFENFIIFQAKERTRLYCVPANWEVRWNSADDDKFCTVIRTRYRTPKKHWILMGGCMAGCLPEYCDVYHTKADALDAARLIFGDEKEFSITELRRYGRTSQNRGYGYVEVFSCDCDNPLIHSDSGEFE